MWTAVLFWFLIAMVVPSARSLDPSPWALNVTLAVTRPVSEISSVYDSM